MTTGEMVRGKHFGLVTLTMLVIANMVGAGVFTTSGHTLQALGSPHWVIVAWILGGLIALAGAASYGQLIRALPESGGEYLFLSRAAHPLFGFLAGWISLIAGFSGAIAFAATALEEYLVPESLRPDWLPVDGIALLAIAICGLCHGLHPRWGAKLQNATVLLKLGLLITFLGFSATRLANFHWCPGRIADAPSGVWPMVGAMASSLVWISLSYSGFNAAVYVAGEVEDAGSTVPKSLWRGTLIVLVLYLLLNGTFVYAAPLQSIAGVTDIGAVVADVLGGPTLATLVRVTISVALGTSILSMMMVAPRVYAKMADDGLMPHFLKFQGDAPRRAILLQAGLAMLLVFSSTLRGLLSYLGLTLSLSAAASVACLFLPSIRLNPIVHRSHVAPLFYIVCTLATALLATIANPWQMVGTVLTLLAGGGLYAVVCWERRGQA